MKRIFAWILVLLVAVSLFAGCDLSEKDVQFISDVLNAALEQSGNDAGSAPENTLVAAQSTAVPDAGPSAPAGTAIPAATEAPEEEPPSDVVYGERYDTPEDVAAYLHAYGELPCNYITKAKARDLGWDSSRGNLWDVAYGYSIGGDRFGNYEGRLPDAPGRKWYECDVNYDGGYRGAERILYASDGLIYYTDDHYSTFTLLYGED